MAGKSVADISASSFAAAGRYASSTKTRGCTTAPRMRTQNPEPERPQGTVSSPPRVAIRWRTSLAPLPAIALRSSTRFGYEAARSRLANRSLVTVKAWSTTASSASRDGGSGLREHRRGLSPVADQLRPHEVLAGGDAVDAEFAIGIGHRAPLQLRQLDPREGLRLARFRACNAAFQPHRPSLALNTRLSLGGDGLRHGTARARQEQEGGEVRCAATGWVCSAAGCDGGSDGHRSLWARVWRGLRGVDGASAAPSGGALRCSRPGG
jgi:hypothetical protein